MTLTRTAFVTGFDATIVSEVWASNGSMIFRDVSEHEFSTLESMALALVEMDTVHLVPSGSELTEGIPLFSLETA